MLDEIKDKEVSTGIMSLILGSGMKSLIKRIFSSAPEKKDKKEGNVVSPNFTIGDNNLINHFTVNIYVNGENEG